MLSTRVPSSLLFSNRMCFSGSKMLWSGTEAPIKHRVMSTPTWPAPYYQRIVKAYPVRNRDRYSLLLGNVEVSDANWYEAKRLLRTNVRGREIVDYTENHVKTNTYLIRQEDTGNMVQAYVNDIVQFLDVAQKENQRILANSTLI